MEIHKDTRWRVRGELEFDTPITVQGRNYRLVGTAPYEYSQGYSGELLVWAGTWVVCGSKFTFETPRTSFYPTATCVKHRGQAIVRKRPAHT
jgi:hypothetical protein